MLVPTPPADRRVAAAASSEVSMELHHYQLEGSYLKCGLSLCRDETSLRKDLKEREHRAFQDLLFSISVVLSDIRRLRQASHPKNVWQLSYNELVAIDAQKGTSKDVWFASPSPRGIPSPPRAIQRLIPPVPNAQVVALEHEEEELRAWVDRLEQKLREPIARDCVNSWMLLTSPRRTEYDESDCRDAIVEEEAKSWEKIVKAFKHATPTAHFIAVVNAAREAAEAELRKNPEQGEALSRRDLEREEIRERAELFSWLFEKYGVRLYSTSRVEVMYRCELEEQEEEESVAIQLLRLCERDFRWSRFALLAMHTTTNPFLANVFQQCLPFQ